MRISSQHRHTLPAALALSLAILALAGSSPAAASPLDLTFGGGDGFATASGFESQPTETVHAMVVQGDGKIILGGQARGSTTNDDFALARFNADGSLDTTFGPANNGKVVVPMDVSTDQINGLTLQSDGKIVAVGEVHTSVASGIDFGVIRLNQNGSLDTTFGPAHDGKLVLPVGTGSSADVAHAAAVQSSGKIVVAGEAQVGPDAEYDFAAVRLNSDGTLDSGQVGDSNTGDTTFGTAGKAFVSIATGSGSEDLLYAMLRRPDDKLVLAGSSDMGIPMTTTDLDFSLAQLTADGQPDTTGFGGGDGVVTLGPPTDNGADTVNALALQTDGKIVAAGSSDVAFGLARFNADGTPDDTGPSAFGTGGFVVTPVAPSGGSSANGVAMQADGKIVAAGEGGGFALARYTSNGSLDPTFNLGGTVVTDFPPTGQVDRGEAVAVSGDRLLVGGTYLVSAFDRDFAVARYLQNDGDSDGVADGVDNCPTVPNPGQANTDGRGAGDACNADQDGDEVDDGFDNCPAVANRAQADLDKDATGNACDPDIDGDGRANAKDNCSLKPNPGQLDTDRDGIGDACDKTPRGKPSKGNDTLVGTSKADTIHGLAGNDTILGLAGNDKLFGDAGNDTLNGGKGNDLLVGGKGKDIFNGGPGDDTIRAADGIAESVDCGTGKHDKATVDKKDTVKGCEQVTRK